MKQFSHLYRYIAACMLAIIAIACSDDGNPLPQKDQTATIRLNIPMLEAKTRINVPTIEQESKIHSLRVIISNEDKTTYINKAFSADELNAGNYIIENVPVGTVQMYVIANEAALGKDYSNYEDWAKDVIEVEGHSHPKVLVQDLSRQYFPKRGSTSEFPEKGLPMSWEALQLPINSPSADGQPQEIEVELIRTVAKLNITMTNTLSNDIVINQMGFGPFFADRLYLFREDALSVPEGTNYIEKNYDQNLSITVPKEGGSVQLALYIYPSAAAKVGEANPYTIGFQTQAGISYDKLPFMRNGLPLTSIARNTQVNINATLSKQANIKVEFEVKDWTTPADINVPPFN